MKQETVSCYIIYAVTKYSCRYSKVEKTLKMKKGVGMALAEKVMKQDIEM